MLNNGYIPQRLKNKDPNILKPQNIRKKSFSKPWSFLAVAVPENTVSQNQSSCLKG